MTAKYPSLLNKKTVHAFVQVILFQKLFNKPLFTWDSIISSPSFLLQVGKSLCACFVFFFAAFVAVTPPSVYPVNSGRSEVLTKAYFALTILLSIFVGSSETGTCSFVRSCQNAVGTNVENFISLWQIFKQTHRNIIF